MAVSAGTAGIRSFGVAAAASLRDIGEPLLPERLVRGSAITLHASLDSLWVVAAQPGGGVALRVAYCPAGALRVREVDGADAWTVDITTALGPIRSVIDFPQAQRRLIHARSSLIPTTPTSIAEWPRDLVPFADRHDPAAANGTVHTAQRGPRSGAIYGSTTDPLELTFLYLQDFSASSAYFEHTHTTPEGSVGGTWPELGYALPPSGDTTLHPSNEYILSDAFLALIEGAPDDQIQMAQTYLDLLAEIYQAMSRPQPVFHAWPDLAEVTLRDLAFSPQVSEQRRGQRYLMPYVDDRSKPPESMVQFTVLLPLIEYGSWSGREPNLGHELLKGIPTFFDKAVGSLVRWLPGEPFLEQTEDVQTHRAMDSWYLYHVFFNLARAARLGDRNAARLFRKSMPFAIKVAHRFGYRWPVFFDLQSLEIIRAESAPGKGGENDVAGLYALVMLEAYDMTGETSYLDEAKEAARALQDLGFTLSYQTNTTGFGAEAMLRLWNLTGDDIYMGLADVCIANLLDNVWLWSCGYGHGPGRRTFFGMFPLHDAPYLAAYEEAEMISKVHDYLNVGRDAIRPSVRLLLAEYARYAVDRLWAYLPAHQAPEAVSDMPRVGSMRKELEIPVEDLQDGWEKSGQVGQEVYGAGMAFVATTRHFRPLPGTSVLLFCDYPVFDLESKRGRGSAGRASFRVGGDRRGFAAIRIIPRDPNEPTPEVRLEIGGSQRQVPGDVTPEGHLRFAIPGESEVRLSWRRPR
jgi:hypothetical protein